MTKLDFKPTISIDFDGVIHDYKHGWKDGSIYGEVTPGFFEWVERVSTGFELVIHTSRAETEEGAIAVLEWLSDRHHAWAQTRGHPEPISILHLDISATKPKAWLSIDDRCIRFDGHWDEHELQPAALFAYRTWTQRG